MKITVTIKNAMTNACYDIQVDNKQRIETTLLVMMENLGVPIFYSAEKTNVYSERKQRYINIKSTYEDAKIYTGDELIISKRK